MRAACCMLWVTITTEILLRISRISSSILAGAVGSSAAAPQLHQVDPASQYVHAREKDGPFVAHRREEVVHPVETAEHRRFSATGGTDDGRDLELPDRKADGLQHLVRSVPER